MMMFIVAAIFLFAGSDRDLWVLACVCACNARPTTSARSARARRLKRSP